MRRSPSRLLLLTALLAGCAETISVGDAERASSIGEDITLAQLASELKGAWYGSVVSPFGQSDIAMTFTPREGRRDGAFAVTCRGGACTVADNVFGLLFVDPEPVEGTADPFATGVFQLVTLMEDDELKEVWWAKCLMTSYDDAAPPAISTGLLLSDDDDGELLRMKIGPDAFDFRREPD